MIWCKSTFVRHFSDDRCRLFPTQQQLFDFIDVANKETNQHYKQEEEEEEEETNVNKWLPYGIEFPSEEEVVRELSTRSLRSASNSTNTSGSSGSRNYHPHRTSTGTLFRKRLLSPPREVDEPQEQVVCVKRQRRAVREDYVLLYGATPLSTQSRMFLATTRTGLAQLVESIEPQQMHLYEVIRDGTPCHFYLDVEREKDYSAWHTVVDITDVNSNSGDSGSTHTEEDVESVGQHMYCNAAGYTQALATAIWQPPLCCQWNCALRADNRNTKTVLLAELRDFLHTAYPDLLVSTHREREEVKDDDAGLGNDVEVIVMRSTTQPSQSQEQIPSQSNSSGSTSGEKFSQHYVVKFKGRWFHSNAHVGRLVSHFVDYLYERAAVAPHVHTALFYHNAPKEFPVLPPGQKSLCLPFLPLRCVIDTAVYSRNRMLRCLGSCKLHKTSILQWEFAFPTYSTSTTNANPTTNTSVEKTVTEGGRLVRFFSSLVSLPQGHRTHIHIPLALTATSTSGAAVGVSTETRYDGYMGGGHSTPIRPLDHIESEKYTPLTEYVARVWSAVGGLPCRVSSIRQCGGRYLLLLIEGSRYCERVQREHRSNHVYITVDLRERVWMQKCFDPDCVAYRSTPRSIPPSLVLKKQHEWLHKTQEAALAAHAASRTVFRPS